MVASHEPYAGGPPLPNLHQVVIEEMAGGGGEGPMTDSIRKAAASYDPARAGLSQEEVRL